MSAPAEVCELWCAPADVVACSPCTSVVFDTDVLNDAIATASDVLFELSGRQYPGHCSSTVRPNRDEWAGARGIGSVGLDGAVYGTPAGGGGAGAFGGDYRSDRNLGVGPISEVRLPGYPVVSITKVTVDGAVVPNTAYKINDDRWLLRVDGGFWPAYQDLTKATTEIGTFEVEYVYGSEVPPAGRRAAAVFACEIAKACTPGTTDCKLPQRVTQITRQGMSVALLDPQDFLDHGRTGLYLVDLFIKAKNPQGIRERAQGFSPDVNWPVHRLR